jgi:PAS domain S-box-containing protein
MALDEFLEDVPILTPQQRRQIQAAFQVALVESPLPTVLTDLDGRILGTNTLVEELLGVDTELVANQDRHLTEAVIRRLASGRTRRESYETRWIRPDGRLLWVHRHVLRVDGPDGDAQPYLVALLEDVTRARLAEREAARRTDLSKRIAAGASIADIAARLGELAEQRWSQVGCMLNIAEKPQVSSAQCPTHDCRPASRRPLRRSPSPPSASRAGWPPPTVALSPSRT